MPRVLGTSQAVRRRRQAAKVQLETLRSAVRFRSAPPHQGTLKTSDLESWEP